MKKLIIKKIILLTILISSFGILFSMNVSDQNSNTTTTHKAEHAEISYNVTNENCLLSKITKLSDIQSIIAGYCKNEWSLFYSFSATIVSYSPCNKYIASVSSDDIIKIWALDDNNESYFHFKTLTDHEKLIRSLSFCNNGKYLTSGSEDGAIKIWDMDLNSELYSTCVATIVNPFSSSVTAVEFFTNNFSIAAKTGIDQITIWKSLETELLRKTNKILL